MEGLVLVDDLLRGAGLREHVKVICSGKVGVDRRRRATTRALKKYVFRSYVLLLLHHVYLHTYIPWTALYFGDEVM